MGDDKINYSKKGQRKISSFVGNELLYDYLSRKLDDERMRAMDEVVAENREIQDEIQSLNSALNYVEHLRDFDLSDNLMEQVQLPISYSKILMDGIHFHAWPDGLKLALETVAVLSVVVFVGILMPWGRIQSMSLFRPKEIVLSQVENEFKHAYRTETEISSQGNVEAPLFQDEHASPNPTPVVQSVAAEAPKTTPAPTGLATAEVIPKSVPKTKSQVAVVKDENANEKKQGWLYRGAISVINLPTTTEKFVQKIGDLGGRKAGEVELGWKKSEDSYFHFTIPESHYDELKTYLSDYGQLKLQKEKHDRVMPDGILRIIITVSESKKKSTQ